MTEQNKTDLIKVWQDIRTISSMDVDRVNQHIQALSDAIDAGKRPLLVAHFDWQGTLHSRGRYNEPAFSMMRALREADTPREV